MRLVPDPLKHNFGLEVKCPKHGTTSVVNVVDDQIQFNCHCLYLVTNPKIQMENTKYRSCNFFPCTKEACCSHGKGHYCFQHAEVLTKRRAYREKMEEEYKESIEAAERQYSRKHKLKKDKVECWMCDAGIPLSEPKRTVKLTLEDGNELAIEMSEKQYQKMLEIGKEHDLIHHKPHPLYGTETN